MTTGHKHRHVKVKKDSLVMRTLCARLFTTVNLKRVDASPYPYGPVDEDAFRAGKRDQPYYLSALSILHRWTGLTLEYDEPEPEPGSTEYGRRLASEREDLIAEGVDPSDLIVPLAPEEE